MLAVLEGFGVITGVILTGYVLGRTGVLGDDGQQVIARLVFWAATPALLFITVAKTELTLIFSSALIATGGSAVLVGVAVYLLTKLIMRRSTGESLFSAWAVSYVNIGNLGIPIAAYVLGDIGYVAPVLLFQLCVLSPIGMAVLDSTRRGPGAHWWSPLRAVIANPILIGAAAGMLASVFDIPVPSVIWDPLEMLAAISVPGALLAFGISFKDGLEAPAKGTRRQLTLLVSTKLIIQPLIAWVIGGPILGWTGTDLLAIVVTSTLPTAQNVFIYSMRYKQSEQLVRDAVFLSTLLSVPALIIVAVLLGS